MEKYVRGPDFETESSKSWQSVRCFGEHKLNDKRRHGGDTANLIPLIPITIDCYYVIRIKKHSFVGLFLLVDQRT